MSHPLFSVEWIRAYQELWNENERAIEGTKGLGALVEFVVTDQDDRPPVHFNVTVEGIADYAGPLQEDEEPFFRLTATTETWRKVAHQEIGTKRAVTGPVKFHGSLLTALKYFDGLDAALKQIGDVPTAEWAT
jgi:putative sterol carrier protein